MGTKVHCKSHNSGYYSMKYMNEDSNSSSCSPYYGDKNLLNGQYYNGLLQRTVRDKHTGHEKDVLKQKMVEHDTIFKNQVHELHRVYRKQREMMEEAKTKELYKQQRSFETSSSSSFLPSRMPSDEVVNRQKPRFPLANPDCIRPSLMGSEIIDSPSSCMKGYNGQVDLVSRQNSCDVKECTFLDSRPSKARKKLFDLQIPADEYIVTEGEEQFRDNMMSKTFIYPPEGNCRLAPRVSKKENFDGGKANDLKDTSSDSCMKIPRLLADLNEPLQVEDDNAPKFVNFSGRCYEEIRGLDLSAKPKSQFVDLTQDFYDNSQRGSSNRNLNNLSEINEGTRRGWSSHMYGSGNHGTDRNCIPKLHESEQLPTTSQQTPYMAGKCNQHLDVLPTVFRKEEPWIERNRNYEFSNRSLGLSNHNRPDTVMPTHISNPYPWYNSSDAANSCSHSVTSWGKYNPSLTQKLKSLHTKPSDMASETSSRDMYGSLNHNRGSKFPTQNGFRQGSSLVSKEISATLSSSGYNNLKPIEIDIVKSKHLTSHGSENAFKGLDVMDLKSGNVLDLNVTPPIDSNNEECLPQDIGIFNGKRKFEDHSTHLSWLREKPMYNKVPEITRKDLQSGLLQDSCNSLLKAENAKGYPLSAQNVSAALSSCDVRVKRESDCFSNGKLFGFPMHEKLCTSIKDSSSTRVSVLSCSPDGENRKEESKHRGFDINVACDLTDDEFDNQIVAETNLEERVKDTKRNNFRNFDLNSCINEEEDLAHPSLASTSEKVQIPLDINLELPAVLDTMEAVLPGEEQKEHEVSLQSPLQETEQQGDQARTAAESIVAISSYSQDPHMECTHVDSSELPDSLIWFADVISSSAEDFETRLCTNYNGRNGKEIETSRELDDYEAMTLQLKDTPEEDYMPEPFVPEINNLEEVGTTTLPSRTRRGPARRGRMRKDFQRDILPGLVSLSRHEVTEDLQIFGGLMRATGHQWNGGLTRRNGARSGAARGRRRCVVESSPAVVVAPVCNTLMQNFNSIKVGVEDRSLAGWGKTTRRPRGQRSAAGNNLAVAMT